MNDDEKSKSEADQRTYIALVAIIVIAHSLLGVMALVLPQLFGVVLVVGGIGWFAAMHYVVWGWWLGGYLRRLEEKKESEDRDQESDGGRSDF